MIFSLIALVLLRTLSINIRKTAKSVASPILQKEATFKKIRVPDE